MADTLTTFMSLVKQAIGGNRNTWGTILNANMDLIDASVAGMHTVTTTGGSTTLADTEWIKRIVKVAGALLSTTTIVFPNKTGVWLVYNGTTGSFTVSVKTSSGSAVALAQGGWNTVWCDGNDVMRAGPSSLLFSSQFQAPDGTLALPGISFANDTDTGLRRAGYSSGTLGSNPFTTTNLSTTVTVAHTAHGMASNDFAFYSGATAAGGVTIDGLYPVTVVNANSYTIVHSAAATSGATGGGTPAYKYMMAAATSGNAFALTANGADVAHVSPYGVIWTGSVYSSGAARFAGNAIIGGTTTLIGALTAAAATFSGLVTGAAATLSGLLTLSSTSHMSMAGGTTAQRPAGTEKDFRTNSTLNAIEFYLNGGWNVVQAGQLPRGYHAGGIASNGDGAGGGDQDHDITFTSGAWRDSTNTVNMAVAVATKQLDANWVAGNSGGMRNSAAGLATNGTYHIYTVTKADGTEGKYACAGVAGTDADSSASIAAVITALHLETGGTDYLYARRLCSIVVASSVIRPFVQFPGGHFRLKSPVLSIDAGAQTTTAALRAMTSPLGLRVLVEANVRADRVVAGNASGLYIMCPDVTAEDPSLTVAPGISFYSSSQINTGSVVASGTGARIREFTDLSAQWRFDCIDAMTVYASTLGWQDFFGTDA